MKIQVSPDVPARDWGLLKSLVSLGNLPTGLYGFTLVLQFYLKTAFFALIKMACKVCPREDRRHFEKYTSSPFPGPS